MSELTLESIPADLRADVRSAWDSYLASGGAAALLEHDAIRRTLPRVWACSRFVAESCARAPAMIAELAASGELERARGAQEIGSAIAAAAAAATSETQLMKALRQARRRELVRIA